MIIMSFFKVIFLLLLCIPIVYLMIYFLSKMIDEVLKQQKSRSKKKSTDRRNIR